MRSLLAIIICLAFAVPGIASAQSLSPEQVEQFRSVAAHPAECSRLRRQVDQYVNMQHRAATLGNEMWKGRLGEQVSLLRGMQAARCPGDLPVDEAGRAFQEFLRLAAKGAITYFTFGMYGF